MKCPDIGQPLATLTAGGNFYLGDPVTRADGSPSRLYALPDYFNGGSRDVESLVAGLWTILGSFIFEGKFSFRHGGYEPFDADDLDFIQRVLKTDEES